MTVTDKTLSGGSVTLNDGASGNNSVSAAGDTSASKAKTLNYYTGSGTDSFTGGFENDVVQVSAAAVGGDTLTGGSGTNTLTLTSAGSVNLGGVSKFATINLAAGNSTVTVTDTTLSGGTVTINDGASGNNSVSAAGDTSASKGKTLNYTAGSGTDSFTGGFENDKVHVSAAAVGGDTLTGGSGTNTLMLTTRRQRQSRRGQQVRHDRPGCRQQHGDGDRHDAVRWDGDDQRRRERQQHRQRGGRHLGQHRQDAHLLQPGAGTDSFTGGFENDTVRVSAAAVGGDTLTGGSGANTLMLTSAGDGQPRRGQQVRHDQPCCRQQHGDGDRHDTVRRHGDDQRRGERQQHHQRGGRHVGQHRQDARSIQPGRGRTASPAGSRTTRSASRRRRWAATR